ncbi:MAG: hypothetical protein LBN08_02875 [Lactobacillales bacterium]|jgi:hypothetical protein|nr:hypothetical protein [Lactobacillales bacterium]
MHLFKRVKTSRDTAKHLIAKGWKFDWSSAQSAKTLNVALENNGLLAGLVDFERVRKDKFNFIHKIEVSPDNFGKNKRIEAGGILLAFVADDSFHQGYEGFVVFNSKSNLVNIISKNTGRSK